MKLVNIDENYPRLPELIKALIQLLKDIARLLVILSFRFLYLMACLIGGVFARRDINVTKVQTIFSLVLNLLGKVLKHIH